MIPLLQFSRAISRRPASDHPAIHFDHRHHYSAGARQETFVRVENVVTGQIRFGDPQAKLSREIIEKIAWEVVPELAETIIKQQLDKLAAARQ